MRSQGQEASKASIGNPNTCWLTARRDRGQPHPHELTIVFPQPLTISGLLVLPRQDHASMRAISQLHRSDERRRKEWREVASGRLESRLTQHRIVFGKPTTDRYLKLRALEGFGGDTAASVAELNVLTGDSPPPVIRRYLERGVSPALRQSDEAELLQGGSRASARIMETFGNGIAPGNSALRSRAVEEE